MGARCRAWFQPAPAGTSSLNPNFLFVVGGGGGRSVSARRLGLPVPHSLLLPCLTDCRRQRHSSCLLLLCSQIPASGAAGVGCRAMPRYPACSECLCLPADPRPPVRCARLVRPVLPAVGWATVRPLLWESPFLDEPENQNWMGNHIMLCQVILLVLDVVFLYQLYSYF